jgi:hypothetical protein
MLLHNAVEQEFLLEWLQVTVSTIPHYLYLYKDITTAKRIAQECGILTDGVAIEGPDFAKLTGEELDDLLPRLQVLARSSPTDKYTLVTR